MPELTKLGKKIRELCNSEEEFLEVFKLYAEELHSMLSDVLKMINRQFKEEVLSCFEWDDALIKAVKKTWSEEDAKKT